MENILNQYFEFSTFIEKLKKIERYKGQFYWKDYPSLARYESVADHTWRIAILLLLFEDKLSQKINTEKALKMTLVHDLPEVIAGDDSPMGNTGTGQDSHAYNKQKQKERFSKEEQAARQLFYKLDEKKGHELYHLWLEYEKQEVYEAKIIKALDRIEALLQVLEYRKGNMFKQHLDFTIKYCTEKTIFEPILNEFAIEIAGKMKENFKEYKNSS
jgi:putative hydrolase of HD superfamily